MTTQEAIKMLQQYQDWRTGKDPRNMTEAGIEPKKITAAINVAIDTLTMNAL